MTFDELCTKLSESGRFNWQLDHTGWLRGTLKGVRRIPLEGEAGTCHFCPLTAAYFLRTGKVLGSSQFGAAGKALDVMPHTVKIITELADNVGHERKNRPDHWRRMHEACGSPPDHWRRMHEACGSPVRL